MDMDGIKRELFTRMRDDGVDPAQIRATEQAIEEKIRAEADPRIALIGFTGVGKTSTLNALFNAGRPISDVRACTQEAHELRADVAEYTGARGKVIVYDMPGLGEDITADKKHLGTYERVLPRIDVAVWTFQAADRAMSPMQSALLNLAEHLGPSFLPKLMFAVNKADATAPGEGAWNTTINVPSPQQRKNIEEFERYILEKVHQVAPRLKPEIVTYSARRRYRLDVLMTAMVASIPPARRWVLDQRADVADYRETIDPKYLALIEQHAEELGARGHRPWQRKRD